MRPCAGSSVRSMRMARGGNICLPRKRPRLLLLALLTYHRTVGSLSHEPLRRAAEYLVDNERPLGDSYPQLWISKALYAPEFVIRSSVAAALGLYHDTFGD
jgi:hypothetical protein